MYYRIGLPSGQVFGAIATAVCPGIPEAAPGPAAGPPNGEIPITAGSK